LPASAFSFEGGEAYAVDGMTPSMVVKPSSQAEVAAALAAAREAGAAVVPFGGGTQQHLGMPPRRYDVALDLRRLDRLIEHEPADLTVTVEAGMRLSALQQRLGQRGQWLPLDPPVAAEATIGGVLATNVSGPARLSRGTARDLVIGMTVATVQGDLVKSGGRVVKNVAGYDLAKLHIGALGTTGVIVQVSFKIAPVPVRTATIAVRGDLDALSGLANEVEGARLALQGCALSKPAEADQWTLGLRFAAGAAAVERSLRETAALGSSRSLAAEDAEEAVWPSLLLDHASGNLVVGAGVLPTDLAEVAQALASAGASVWALPGVGVMHAAWTGDVDVQRLRRLRELVETRHGALIIEKALVETKLAIDVWGKPRGDFALMQRLKQEMDPAAILNPGRYLGGI
jgi:glycolate oxidase FAD binding subunit